MKTSELNRHIASSEELKEYLMQKAVKHNYYKHYALYDRIIRIKQDKKLYLGCGENWNDSTDRDNFNSDAYETRNYGICFSFAREESVAMWMLYGGIEKKSGMIDFTRSIHNILSIDQIQIGRFYNDKFIAGKTVTRPDFDIKLIDMVYVAEHTDGYFIKRSDEKAVHVPKSVIKGLSICKKQYPWSYENECRLVVCVKKSVLPEDTAGLTDVCIDLKGLDLGTSLKRIYSGPCYCANDDGVRKSSLDQTVDWSLCEHMDDCGRWGGK